MPTHLHPAITTLILTRGNLRASEVDVCFELPAQAWVDSLAYPTINLFLFDLAEKSEMRNAGATVTRGNGRATTRLPPRRVELRYLVCAFSSVTEDEHALLWRTMATLLKYTTLPHELLPEKVRDMDIAIQTKVGRAESDPRALELWGALDLPPRPALFYSVTAPMDLDVTIEAPLVLSRTVRFIRPSPEAERSERGISAADIMRRDSVLHQYAPREGVQVAQRPRRDGKEADQEQLAYRIGGIVRDGQGEPITGATVGVEGRANEYTTDADGRFRLSKIPDGHARLWVKPQGGALKLIDVELPWPFDIDYDRQVALYHVTATLYEPGGRPLGGVMIGTAERAVIATTDAQGQFRLIGIAAGKCELFLFSKEAPPRSLGSVDIPSLFDLIIPADMIT